MFRFIFFALIFVGLCSFQNTAADAQEFNDLSFVELERQLNLILKTRRDEEKAYVAAIVKLSKEDKLPRKLIHASFKYVKKKRPNTKYPFVYFVRVLQFLGDREKVEIPKFDFSIYSSSRSPRRSSTRSSSGSFRR